MRPLHQFSRTSDVADAMNELIADRGLKAPSQRQIASTVRLSPGTLMHEYGSRAEMLRRACVQVGRDHARVWRERLDETPRGEVSPAALLPTSAADLAHERLWAAWRELSRGDVALLPGLGLGVEGERDAVDQVRSRLGREHDDRLSDTAHALLVGVITRMLDQDAPWSLDHAAEVVAAGWT
ncbi:hypothetical protein I601_1056 [Nocardioides dokdonensis FR1436]|uniref:Uncharacterized protein n=1 Tax=Nocardioides dokdonensis FR1436 TaxID=1300347 RepID=A0A1A9GGT8_9ACTN|nr:TetR family transcriptional regulator [Nocardioides dokdonensis]ANH37498.1 hypothetical protein I601_1056 [Nocardioides dokdonensis FR1436]